MAIIKVRNPAIDLDAAEIPNLDASKITTGSFDASRIGSGTFADARISASSVSQHATSFDDNKIVNDISTLALRQASDQNKSAYSTGSSSVDVFQDATGIDTTTNVTRTDDEFIASVYTTTPVAIDYFNPTQAGGGTTNYQVYANGMQSSNNTWLDITSSVRQYFDYAESNAVIEGYNFYSPGNSGANYYLKFDYKETKQFGGGFYIGKINTWGDISNYRIEYSTDDVTYTAWNLTGVTQSDLVYGATSGVTSGGTLTSADSSGNLYLAQNSTSIIHSSNSRINGTPIINARYFKVMVIGLHGGTSNYNAGIGAFQPFTQTTANNATGNFTGTTITAPSSVSSMGAIITYQDNAGTNALNTDIVLQLSADGGSNYSTATLTALPNFATGIKMAKVNDLAVTAGTNLKYKLSFANQASGTKEARIRGVALQY